MKTRNLRWLAIAIVVAAGAWLAHFTRVTAADEPRRPKLIVLVVFDQLRGDYLLRWHDYFGPDGFQRLARLDHGPDSFDVPAALADELAHVNTWPTVRLTAWCVAPAGAVVSMSPPPLMAHQ